MKEYTFSGDKLLVSKTDLNGKIKYASDDFCDIAQFSEQELLGKPHNILRHPDMPRTIFNLLWKTLSKKNEVNAYVINRTKDGGFYWVYANITPSVDSSNKIVGYHSSRRKPSSKALHTIQPIYKELRRIEQYQGLNSADKYLNNYLYNKGLSYEEFVISI